MVFSILRRAIGVQRILAGLFAIICMLFLVEDFNGAPAHNKLGYIIILSWAVVLALSGVWHVMTGQAARLVSAALAITIFFALSDQQGLDVAGFWFRPVPHDTSLDELLRWFILPLSFALLVLEAVVPPWPFLKWRIWIEPSQA